VTFDSVTTGTGDSGDTGTFSGERLPKDDSLFDLLGSLDELASWLGLIKAAVRHGLEVGFQDRHPVDEQLERIQRHLHHIMAEAATSPESELYRSIPLVSEADLAHLERHEAANMETVTIPEEFVVPGATRLSATIDIARTVCRRAERAFVRWIRTNGIEDRPATAVGLKYVNRLSDYLFVLARTYDG
jgi:cob(I)alamin adenosyltransferase